MSPLTPGSDRHTDAAASSDDVTLGDIAEQEMWEEHTRERVKQMREASSAAQGQRDPWYVLVFAPCGREVFCFQIGLFAGLLIDWIVR